MLAFSRFSKAFFLLFLNVPCRRFGSIAIEKTNLARRAYIFKNTIIFMLPIREKKKNVFFFFFFFFLNPVTSIILVNHMPTYICSTCDYSKTYMYLSISQLLITLLRS